MQKDLIPRLPDDESANCLQRVDHDSLFLLASVCRRRLASLAQPLLPFYLSDWPDICNTWFVVLFNPRSGL